VVVERGERPMGDEATKVECPTCGKAALLESEEEANREVTHCEWCGAEYPVPEEHAQQDD
jgi:endogenous inhibitor of DNA gyrase (YacG/DUF329 family)